MRQPYSTSISHCGSINFRPEGLWKPRNKIGSLTQAKHLVKFEPKYLVKFEPKYPVNFKSKHLVEFESGTFQSDHNI